MSSDHSFVSSRPSFYSRAEPLQPKKPTPDTVCKFNLARVSQLSVTNVVPPSQVLSTAINLAKEIVSNSPEAVWSTKKALLEGQRFASLEEAVIQHNLSEESKRVYQGDNIREGLLAFSEVSRSTPPT
jgi:enoyl-CoA hydratase/carnithine racemase